MLPVKLKIEVWTVYARDFEQVEQLQTLSAKVSQNKKKMPKRQVKQKTGLQDWHIGDAVTSEIVKLDSRPTLTLSQAGHIRHLASQARLAAHEQLQTSLADGCTPEQVQRSMERDHYDNGTAATGLIRSTDDIRKSQQRLLALEAKAEQQVDVVENDDASCEAEQMLEQRGSLSLVGTL